MFALQPLASGLTSPCHVCTGNRVLHPNLVLTVHTGHYGQWGRAASCSSICTGDLLMPAGEAGGCKYIKESRISPTTERASGQPPQHYSFSSGGEPLKPRTQPVPPPPDQSICYARGGAQLACPECFSGDPGLCQLSPWFPWVNQIV